MVMFGSEPPNMEIHSFDEPLSLSICLSIYPSTHPSIYLPPSLPPSLSLSLSSLSLSLDASFDVKSTLDLFAGGNSDVSDIYAWLDCVCFSLSLWMLHLMSNPRLICVQEVTLMCQISTHD